MTDPDSTPTQPTIPAASGIVAIAGRQPVPEILIKVQELWSKKSTRDMIAAILYAIVGALVPGAAQSLVLKELEPHITAIIETGSK